MSPESANLQQAKMKEFMQLLPLTLELAGLPKAEPGKQFTEGQMEVRVIVLRNAFKLAKQLLIEVSKPSE
jgi:hypothetical protein